MQQIQTRIRYTGAIAALLKKREWNQQVEEPSWHAPGHLWHQEFKARHFTIGGFREYQYTPRKGQDLPRGSKAFWRSYFGRKLRQKKHSRPLEFSGELKQEVMSTNVVRATSRGMKAITHGRKANWRHPNSQVEMYRELTRISPREARRMVRSKERAMIRRIRAVRTAYTEHAGG